MDIKNGNCYHNKTWKYLIPCLKNYGINFIEKLDSVFILATGIYDNTFENTNDIPSKNVYILIDTHYDNISYNKFIEYVRGLDFYVKDYCPDADFLHSNKQMFVIKIPEVYHNAYDMFLEGKYSQMYTTEDIDKLFLKRKSRPSMDVEVLTKNENARTFLLDSINREFYTDLKITDFTDDIDEYELPLKNKEEIFNFNKSEPVFFNKKNQKL